METYRNTNDEKKKINRDQEPFNVGAIIKFLLKPQAEADWKQKVVVVLRLHDSSAKSMPSLLRFLKPILAETHYRDFQQIF